MKGERHRISPLSLQFNLHPILMQFFFFLQNDHLYGLLMNQKNFLHIWKQGRYILHLKVVIVKQDKCPKYNGSSIIQCPSYDCVQQFTVSSKILCQQLLLIYIYSTFHCRHTAVVSCFTLCSPLSCMNISYTLFIHNLNFR